jgi:hypothetical protein
MAYFANGTEGMNLDEQCHNCIHGLNEEAYCPIYHAQIEFNYDQLENQKLQQCLNILISKKGDCKMKETLDKLNLLKNQTSNKCDLELWEQEQTDRGL